jgi:hypothetical protein
MSPVIRLMRSISVLFKMFLTNANVGTPEKLIGQIGSKIERQKVPVEYG